MTSTARPAWPSSPSRLGMRETSFWPANPMLNLCCGCLLSCSRHCLAEPTRSSLSEWSRCLPMALWQSTTRTSENPRPIPNDSNSIRTPCGTSSIPFGDSDSITTAALPNAIPVEVELLILTCNGMQHVSPFSTTVRLASSFTYLSTSFFEGMLSEWSETLCMTMALLLNVSWSTYGRLLPP